MADVGPTGFWGGSVGEEAEDYSSAATIVAFDPPLPLLRAPVPAAAADDPASGTFVLAFRNAASWRSAWRATEAKILSQCEAGARSGCAITASSKCKPPWWKSLFGSTAADFEDRERCEEREMASCLAASKEACIMFAKEKCLAPFQGARIASAGLLENSGFVLWGAEDKTSSTGETAKSEPGCEATNYRGSVLQEKLSVEDNIDSRLTNQEPG